MFKIANLVMYDYEGNKYIYHFSEGINYFQGPNNTGKTEFYKFIDFMLGSSEKISNYDWYKNCLSKATMEILVNSNRYWLTRTVYADENYFKRDEDIETESIELSEYKNKLNEIFVKDEVTLRQFREFVEEDMSYRTFTMFNFLGEKGQGFIRDFLDKCRDVKYASKLASVLNYIFNDNIKQILSIKKEIEKVSEAIQELNAKSEFFEFVKNNINSNLLKINSNMVFNGHNCEDILSELSKIMKMEYNKPYKLKRSISDLEVIYSNLTEQIKMYDATINTYCQNEKNNKNRKKLLSNLAELLQNKPDMEYLIEPLRALITEVDDSIAFGKYVISDKTIKILKKQRQEIIEEIKKQDSKFECYSLDEKNKAIALIQTYLREDVKDVSSELAEKREKLRDLKNKLKELQNDDDSKKIKVFSDMVTKFYKSGMLESEIIKSDFERSGFSINYLKKGNALQPVAEKYNNKKDNDNLYLGSMARYTLIQLSGYLAFILILIKENKYPIIPLLVFDHLSKPFSDDNRKAVGSILNQFFCELPRNNVQIFIFDDKDPELLGIKADHYELLKNEDKTGFCPFYKAL